MTLNETRTILTKELSKVYDKDELKNVIDLVLEHITGFPKSQQLKSNVPYLSCTQLEDLDSITERLKKNEPVQYVLGETWFGGMKFRVNKHVLIPRPETEELVDWIIKEINSRRSMPRVQSSIIDIGTGSGCIPITLKKNLTNTNVTAIDVCSEALLIASENAIEHDSEINFLLLDFLHEKNWEELGNYDIIVSNPPYVRQGEKKSLHERVSAFEPDLALFVPDNDPLLFYRKLSGFAIQHLNPGGILFVEINETSGNEVVELFQSAGFPDVQLKKDMQGKERMVKATSIS